MVCVCGCVMQYNLSKTKNLAHIVSANQLKNIMYVVQNNGYQKLSRLVVNVVITFVLFC